MVSEARPLPNPAFYSLPFFLAFALSIVMVTTDTNLQTNFGTVTSGYYFHWYVVLGTAVADIVGAVLLLLVRSRTAFTVGVIGSGLLVAIFLGDVLAYSQVGFSSASAFANYLFGITYYGGDVRYLYDLLLAVYISFPSRSRGPCPDPLRAGLTSRPRKGEVPPRAETGERPTAVWCVRKFGRPIAAFLRPASDPQSAPPLLEGNDGIPRAIGFGGGSQR